MNIDHSLLRISQRAMRDTRLTRTDCLILHEIQLANDRGMLNFYPPAFALKCGVKIVSIEASINRLRDAGYITSERIVSVTYALKIKEEV